MVRGFRLPTNLGITKLQPDHINGTALVFFVKNSIEYQITVPFAQGNMTSFEASLPGQIQSYIAQNNL